MPATAADPAASCTWPFTISTDRPKSFSPSSTACRREMRTRSSLSLSPGRGKGRFNGCSSMARVSCGSTSRKVIAGAWRRPALYTPELGRTIADYNTGLAAGKLGELPVARSSAIKPWPIVQAPFMAIPVLPGITYTMGGIVIDEKSQVLREDGQPIPGLLAAGASTGGLEGGRHTAYLGGLLKAGAFGLIAAERAAEIVATTHRPRNVVHEQRAPALAPMPPASSAGGLSSFPALKVIARYGALASFILGVAVAILAAWLGWSLMSAFAILVAVIAGALAALIGVSYTELIQLITGFLMPSSGS